VDVFDVGNVWASPLIYDGKVYCRGGEELVVFDVGGK
jgi:hypothetical protein